jgi:threonine synthase
MDVGNPSNFIRIQELFDNDFKKLKQQFSSYSFTDDETKSAMKDIKEISGYVADPHGAVGYLGANKHLKNTSDTLCVFLETAHPVKFLNVVEETLDIKVKVPLQIQAILHKEKVAKQIATYEELKEFLNS